MSSAQNCSITPIKSPRLEARLMKTMRLQRLLEIRCNSRFLYYIILKYLITDYLGYLVVF